MISFTIGNFGRFWDVIQITENKEAGTCGTRNKAIYYAILLNLNGKVDLE